MNTHNFQLVSFSLKRSMLLLLAASCCLLLATLTQAQTFSVPGTSGSTWVDTHLDIAPGTLLRLAAVDQVDIGGGAMYGPRGTPKFDGTGYPAETRNRYGLVARLTLRADINPGRSEDGLFEQFAYGELPGNRYCAARGGRLWFTVNDNSPADNRGAFTVILTRGNCRSEAEQARLRVSLYATAEGLSQPRTQFRFGAPIVLRIENNSEASIYFRRAIDQSRLIREEGLQVERAVGSGYIRVLPSGARPDQVIIDNGDNTATSTFAGGPLTELMELRSTMNTARRWAVIAPNVAGSYRLKLVYYDSRDTQRPPHTIYSPTFEVQ